MDDMHRTMEFPGLTRVNMLVRNHNVTISPGEGIRVPSIIFTGENSAPPTRFIRNLNRGVLTFTERRPSLHPKDRALRDMHIALPVGYDKLRTLSVTVAGKGALQLFGVQAHNIETTATDEISFASCHAANLITAKFAHTISLTGCSAPNIGAMGENISLARVVSPHVHVRTIDGTIKATNCDMEVYLPSARRGKIIGQQPTSSRPPCLNSVLFCAGRDWQL